MMLTVGHPIDTNALWKIILCFFEANLKVAIVSMPTNYAITEQNRTWKTKLLNFIPMQITFTYYNWNSEK